MATTITKYLVTQFKGNDGEMVQGAYRLEVEDLETYMTLDKDLLLTAIKAKQSIKGVVWYDLAFLGNFDETKGKYGKWAGTVLKPVNNAWYLYEGDIEFNKNCTNPSDMKDLKFAICDSLKSFIGKRYLYKLNGEKCYNTHNYDTVKLWEDHEKGFVSSYMNDTLVDSIYYILGKPLYRFTNSSTKKLIKNYNELKSTRQVDIEYLGNQLEEVFTVKRATTIPNENAGELGLIFTGKVLNNSQLEYEGDFLLSNTGYIKHGNGRHHVIKNGETFVERGTWENDILIEGYGFYNDNIFTEFKKGEVHTLSSFKSTFLMQEGYKVEGKLEGDGLYAIEGTLYKDGTVKGYGKFLHLRGANTLENCIELLVDKSTNEHLHMLICKSCPPKHLTDVNIVLTDSGVTVYVGNDLVFDAPGYTSIPKMPITISELESSLDAISYNVKTIKHYGEVYDILYKNGKSTAYILDSVRGVSYFYATKNLYQGQPYQTYFLYDGRQISSGDTSIKPIYSYLPLEDKKYRVVVSGLNGFATVDLLNKVITTDAGMVLTYCDDSLQQINESYDIEMYLSDAMKNIISIKTDDYLVEGDIKLSVNVANYHVSNCNPKWYVTGTLKHNDITYKGKFYVTVPYHSQDKLKIEFESVSINNNGNLYLIEGKNYYIINDNNLICKLGDKQVELKFNPASVRQVDGLEHPTKLKPLLQDIILSENHTLVGSIDTPTYNDKHHKSKFELICKGKPTTQKILLNAVQLNDTLTPILYMKDNAIYFFKTDADKYLTYEEFSTYEGKGQVLSTFIGSSSNELTLYYDGSFKNGKCHGEGTWYPMTYKDAQSSLYKYIISEGDIPDTKRVTEIKLTFNQNRLDGKVEVYTKDGSLALQKDLHTTGIYETRTEIVTEEVDDWRCKYMPVEKKVTETIQPPKYFLLFNSSPIEVEISPLTFESVEELTQQISNSNSQQQ